MQLSHLRADTWVENDRSYTTSINKNKIRRANDVPLSAIYYARMLDQTYGVSKLNCLLSSLSPCLQKHNSIYEPFYIMHAHTAMF
jgi:hypothetical protein